MGLFDIKGFLYTDSVANDVKGIFSDVGEGTKEVVHEAAGVVKDVVATVFDSGGEIITAVTSDVKDVVVAASADAGAAISGVASNLTMPLMIGAVILGGVLLLKR